MSPVGFFSTHQHSTIFSQFIPYVYSICSQASQLTWLIKSNTISNQDLDHILLSKNELKLKVVLVLTNATLWFCWLHCMKDFWVTPVLCPSTLVSCQFFVCPHNQAALEVLWFGTPTPSARRNRKAVSYSIPTLQLTFCVWSFLLIDLGHSKKYTQLGNKTFTRYTDPLNIIWFL